MARRVVEALSGMGGVYAGDVLLRMTPYELSVWVDEDSSETDTVSIDGHIDIAGMGEAIVLAGPQLTLRLQDGRTLAISLTGTGGGIIGRGGLQPA
jgi:hypothetical protein